MMELKGDPNERLGSIAPQLLNGKLSAFAPK